MAPGPSAECRSLRFDRSQAGIERLRAVLRIVGLAEQLQPGKISVRVRAGGKGIEMFGVHMRMSRTTGVSRVSAHMIRAALVIHPYRSGCASHPWTEREADPRRIPHMRHGAEAAQAGRLRADEVVAVTAVGNVAAVSHEIGVGDIADAVSVATASITSAATSKTAAREMAAATVVATAASSVEAGSATTPSVRPASAAS